MDLYSSVESRKCEAGKVRETETMRERLQESVGEETEGSFMCRGVPARRGDKNLYMMVGPGTRRSQSLFLESTETDEKQATLGDNE